MTEYYTSEGLKIIKEIMTELLCNGELDDYELCKEIIDSSAVKPSFPKEFTEEQHTALQVIFVNLLELISEILQSKISRIINIELCSIDVIPTFDLVRAVENKSIFGIYNMGEESELFCLDIGSKMGCAMTNYIYNLHGACDGINAKYDEQLIINLYESFAECINLAWSKYDSINPSFVEIITDKEKLNLAHSDSKMIVFSCLFEIGRRDEVQDSDILCFYLPLDVLTPRIDK